MSQIIKHSRFENKKALGKPVVIQWKGVRMVRSHSIISVSKQIVNMSKNLDLVSLNFIGKQGTGKSECMRTLAHLVHKNSDIPYTVLFFNKENIINLEETMKNLKPTNHILLFDDIAFLKADVSSVGIAKIESTLAKLRHLEGGMDIKIILMKGFQYSKSISPFLRQNDMTIISSIDDSDEESIVKMLGKKYYKKIKLLKNLRGQGIESDKFVYELGGIGNRVVYDWQNPFVPYLVKTDSSARIVCSVLREWIDPICNVCSNQEVNDENSSTDVNLLIDEMLKKFSQTIVKTAVKVLLVKQGINAFPPNIVQAVRFIEKKQQEKLISLDVLASKFELSETRTSLMPKHSEMKQ